MIKIDKEKCIGCGACVRDCFPGDIKIVKDKAAPANIRCMDCGHCVAVCPTNAVTLLGYNMDEVVELAELETEISPELYLNHLKARRSIRQFTAQSVSEEALKMLLEAGRYSPTGSNLQNVSYFVSRESVGKLRDMIFEELNSLAVNTPDDGSFYSRYRKKLTRIYNAYKKTGRDDLFFNAGTVIVVSSDSPQSAIIASAHMETMVYSLGLGMLYSGFSTRAINESQEIKDFIGLKMGYEVHTVLVIGHPNVKYRRSAPRKPADVIWK